MCHTKFNCLTIVCHLNKVILKNKQKKCIFQNIIRAQIENYIPHAKLKKKKTHKQLIFYKVIGKIFSRFAKDKKECKRFYPIIDHLSVIVTRCSACSKIGQVP